VATDHLTGAVLPDLVLPSSQGAVNVRDFELLHITPRFHELHVELTRGVSAAGLSAQSLEGLGDDSAFPLISDEWLDLARDPGLPTFDVDGATLYERLTLIVERGRIVKVNR
jgi:peroxiredoxin